jgi:hypothetical protein
MLRAEIYQRTPQAFGSGMGSRDCKYHDKKPFERDPTRVPLACVLQPINGMPLSGSILGSVSAMQGWHKGSAHGKKKNILKYQKEHKSNSCTAKKTSSQLAVYFEHEFQFLNNHHSRAAVITVMPTRQRDETENDRDMSRMIETFPELSRLSPFSATFLGKPPAPD